MADLFVTWLLPYGAAALAGLFIAWSVGAFDP